MGQIRQNDHEFRLYEVGRSREHWPLSGVSSRNDACPVSLWQPWQAGQPCPTRTTATMPTSPTPDAAHADRRAALAAAIAIVATVPFIQIDVVRAAWEPISLLLNLQGAPKAVSANVLSDHEIEVLDSMSPQGQASLLLERSINHFQGANEQIE